MLLAYISQADAQLKLALSRRGRIGGSSARCLSKDGVSGNVEDSAASSVRLKELVSLALEVIVEWTWLAQLLYTSMLMPFCMVLSKLAF